VQRGRAWGSLYFSPNYSRSLEERLKDPRYASELTVNESNVLVQMDMSSECAAISFIIHIIIHIIHILIHTDLNTQFQYIFSWMNMRTDLLIMCFRTNMKKIVYLISPT
jgi:hypothetical protein